MFPKHYNRRFICALPRIIPQSRFTIPIAIPAAKPLIARRVPSTGTYLTAPVGHATTLAMPAAVTDDWPAVQTLAVALGSITEAAKRCGVSVDAAFQRAKREAWPVGRRPAKALAVAREAVRTQVKLTGGVVRSVSLAEEIATELADLSSGSRLSLSRAVRRGAAHAEQLAPDDIIERADKLASLVKSAATLGGWADVSAVPVVNVAFLSAGADDRRTRNIESVEVDAQVVEDQGA